MSYNRHPATSIGFVGLLRMREFRLLWAADMQSLLGDQLARVALSVVVYERTGSGLVTAIVYAMSFLPALLGSVVLGPLADRLPRRGLLVGGDIARSVLLAAMAALHVPVAILAVLLALSALVGAPWKAAESALVADILSDTDYVMGVGLRTATVQGAQLAGFALGGLVVAAIGTRAALAVDAATFVASAVVIRLGLSPRPAAQASAPADEPRPGWWDGAAVVFRDRQLRQLVAFTWLLGILVVPEGLAAPYAHLFGGGARTVGVLLAALPTGVLLGSITFARWLSAPARAALVGPLAICAGIPLIACIATPSLPLTVSLWAISGFCTAYQVQVVAEFVGAIPAGIRGQGISVASGGLLVAQGIGLIVGGTAAVLASPSISIAGAGLAAAGLAAILAFARWRSAGTGRQGHRTAARLR